MLCAAGLYYIKVTKSNRFVINNDNGTTGTMRRRSLWRRLRAGGFCSGAAQHPAGGIPAPRRAAICPSFILPIRIRASGTRMTRRGAPLNTKRCGRPDTSETRVEFSMT